MKKFLFLLAFILLPSLVLANEEKIKKYKTYDSLGCLILEECKDNLKQIKSISDIQRSYPNVDYSYVASEFNQMLTALNKIGVVVFLADEKYFPPLHRGVYHTVSNKLYLNNSYMQDPGVFMTVMRHEGWHAAQDCMAGTIDNSMIAIIKPEEDVPDLWRNIAKNTYPKSSLPWETEALWAGKTKDMTMKALNACANGNMWEVYDPTPLTRKWLKENNYLK